MPKVWTGNKFTYSLSGTATTDSCYLILCYIVMPNIFSSLALTYVIGIILSYLILPCVLVRTFECQLFPDLLSSFPLYLASKPALEMLEMWNVCEFKKPFTQIISFVSFQVSYVKAIDWYLIGSFLFVFCVLVEYTFVLYVVNVHNKRLKKIMDLQQIEEAVSNETNETLCREHFLLCIDWSVCSSVFCVRLQNRKKSH